MRKYALAQAVGITPAAVSQYENGSSKPGPRVVSAMALALGMPVDFFAKSQSIDRVLATGAHFRSLRAATQTERDSAHAYASALWDLAHTLERHVHLPKVDIPHLTAQREAAGGDIESIAGEVRTAWELPSGPIANVLRLLESRGVVVTRLTPQTQRVYAFSCPFPGRPVVVLSASRDHKAVSRFDAAHELGHLVMHDDVQPGTHTVEHQAHRFAAAFLAPAEEMAHLLPSRIDWATLFEIKRVWGVSMQALLYRSRELSVISEYSYRRAMRQLSAQGWRTKEPGDEGNAEQPSIIRKALELLEPKGFTIEQLASEVRLPVDLVRRLAAVDDETPSVRI